MIPFSIELSAAPFASLPAFSHWLALPVLIGLSVALLLWSGRVRQPALVNTLGLGILMPAVNLCLVGVGLLTLGHELSSALPTLDTLFAPLRL